MKIIPGLNCADEQCLRDRFAVLRALFEKTGFHEDPLLHLDVSDGIFTPMQTVRNPRVVLQLRDRTFPEARIVAHCMVENGIQCAREWLQSGAAGALIHFDVSRREEIRALIMEYGDRIGTVVTPGTKLEEFIPFAREVSAKNIIVLAVNPGFSGQHFNKKALETVVALRDALEGVTIGVDGGMNPETVARVRKTGATNIVSSSFIFGHEDPVRAFGELEAAAL